MKILILCIALYVAYFGLSGFYLKGDFLSGVIDGTLWSVIAVTVGCIFGYGLRKYL